MRGALALIQGVRENFASGHHELPYPPLAKLLFTGSGEALRLRRLRIDDITPRYSSVSPSYQAVSHTLGQLNACQKVDES
jgi:hypothetical protein